MFWNHCQCFDTNVLTCYVRMCTINVGKMTPSCKCFHGEKIPGIRILDFYWRHKGIKISNMKGRQGREWQHCWFWMFTWLTGNLETLHKVSSGGFMPQRQTLAFVCRLNKAVVIIIINCLCLLFCGSWVKADHESSRSSLVHTRLTKYVVIAEFKLYQDYNKASNIMERY